MSTSAISTFPNRQALSSSHFADHLASFLPPFPSADRRNLSLTNPVQARRMSKVWKLNIRPDLSLPDLAQGWALGERDTEVRAIVRRPSTVVIHLSVDEY
jgi:hypothetical protein